MLNTKHIGSPIPKPHFCLYSSNFKKEEREIENETKLIRQSMLFGLKSSNIQAQISLTNATS